MTMNTIINVNIHLMNLDTNDPAYAAKGDLLTGGKGSPVVISALLRDNVSGCGSIEVTVG